MKGMWARVGSFFIVLMIATVAHAATIVYIFAGMDNSGGAPEPTGFELTEPGFIDLGGSFVQVNCAQLDSSTNCMGDLYFSDQAALGSFSNELEFNTSSGGYLFFFPTASFTTLGVYQSEIRRGANTGILTVELQQTNQTLAGAAPEPASEVMVGAALLLLCHRVKKSRWARQAPG
jgi:hypothetical protein